jgi:hypothetical protein
MEIEFSPSQLPAPRAASPVRPAATPPAANEPPQLQGMGELQRKLNDLALTRPEKLEAARAVISQVKYPPDELLNGIAHLLAIHLSE